MASNQDITFFGLTSFRNQRKRFGIKRDDRRRHFYTIGKTGMGKSNLMENMAIQDIQNGCGIAYVDPHGEGAEKLLDFIPEERIKDVIFFNPADLDYPIAFNVMERVDFKFRHLVAGGLMGVFKKVWPDVWSARMEYILNNTILALLEYPDSTLLGVNRMLSDPEYRKEVVSMVKDPIVKAFWEVEYARYSQKYEIEATAAIQNKVGQFVSNALIRNVIGQPTSTINMRQIMDDEKILILDLSKGRIGEDNSRLLGALLITKIQLAAMSRVDIPEPERRDFYLYVDEFQNFATESFANILSEARKYRLNLIVGHQYINQMDEIVRDAVFGNVGTLAVFRVGAEDAEFLEKEFTPEFTAEDLVNTTKYNIYLKLMIDGVASHPFSAITLPPPLPLVESNRSKIIEASRGTYGVKREIVEEKIIGWMGVEAGKVGAPITPFTIKAKSPAAAGQPPRPAPVVNSLNTATSEGQTTLYDAVCAICGKPTKVIFQPEAGRPVYCKSCLKKMKSQKEAEKASANVPVKESAAPPPPAQPQVAVEEMPIGPVSFKPQRSMKAPVAMPGPKPKRKEINLSELKKALDVAVESKEEEVVEETKVTEETKATQVASVAKEEPKKEEGNGVITPGQKIDL